MSRKENGRKNEQARIRDLAVKKGISQMAKPKLTRAGPLIPGVQEELGWKKTLLAGWGILNEEEVQKNKVKYQKPADLDLWRSRNRRGLGPGGKFSVKWEEGVENHESQQIGTLKTEKKKCPGQKKGKLKKRKSRARAY